MSKQKTIKNSSLRQYGSILAGYLKPLWLKAILLAILVFASIGLQIVNPLIIRYFIDTLVSSEEVRQLFWLAFIFLGASLCLQATGVAATYLGEDVGWQVTNQLRADLARHCLRLDMSFHNNHTPGEMLERIDGDINNIARFFSQFVVRILGNLLLLVGVLIVIAYQNWIVSLALIVSTMLGLIGLSYLRRIAVPHWKSARQASADLFGFLEEQLSGTEDIRSNNETAYVIRNLFKFSKMRLDKELTGSSMNSLISMMWIGLYTLAQAVAFISSYVLLRQGVLTIGSVYLVIYYTNFVFKRLFEIANEIQNLQQAVASIERVQALFSIKSRIKETKEQAVAPVAGSLGVVFDDVTFSYGETEPVLQKISFRLESGKVLGLLGRTGSGKTTITRLLFRLYDPNQGSIHLGMNGQHINIRDIALKDLRRQIGVVTQHVQLFQATLRDNLTFFDKDIPDERLLQAIEELGLLEWYHSLPDGLDGKLETEGSNLSAGEAQLLAFTRIFLRDPDLVVLDEASSRLDPATEMFIERAVDKLLKKRTGIIIAHRLATLHRAEHIMIIDNGRIKEFGDYTTLAHDPDSHFYTLLQTGLEEVLV